jgi:hypothetical protein
MISFGPSVCLRNTYRRSNPTAGAAFIDSFGPSVLFLIGEKKKLNNTKSTHRVCIYKRIRKNDRRTEGNALAHGWCGFAPSVGVPKSAEDAPKDRRDTPSSTCVRGIVSLNGTSRQRAIRAGD